MSVADTNLKIFNEYDAALRQVYMRKARYDSFFRGRQYNRKTIRLLKDSGLLPIVVNIVRPLLRQNRAILTSSRQTWKVVPLRGAEKLIAEAIQQFLVGKWNADYVDVQLNFALKDMLITGCGWLQVDLASFLDNATFDIKIEHVGWRYVFPDPECHGFDCADGENILIRKRVGVNKAQVLYQLTESEVKAATYQSDQVHRDERIPMVDVIDRYSKYPVTRFEVQPRPGELLRNLPTVFYTSDKETIIKRESQKIKADRERLAAEMEGLGNEGKIDLRRMRELHIYRSLSVGQFDVYEGVLDIRDYPLIPFIDEHNDTFKDHQGEVEFIQGIQEHTNKFYLLNIHNAMLTGNAQWIAPAGSITDKRKWQRSASVPGAVKEYEPRQELPDGGRPIQQQQGSISQGFYELGKNLLEMSKFETNTFGPVLGDPSTTPETFSTTASLQQFGTEPIKEIARRVDLQVARVGEVVTQYIQNYTSKSEMLSFIDIDAGDVQQVKDQNGQPIVLNEIVIKDKVISEIKNNARIGQFAVKIGTQVNLGSDRLIKAQLIQNMLMNKAIPPTPGIVGKLLDLMEVPGYQKIMDELRAEMSAQSTANALAERNKQLESTVGIMSNQIRNLNDKVSSARFETELDKILSKAQVARTEDRMQVMDSIRQLFQGEMKGETQHG